MQLPPIVPAPGVLLENATRALRDARYRLEPVLTGDAGKVLEAYQRWASDISTSLGYSFDPADVETVVLTRRHWLLQQMTIAGNGPSVLAAVRAEVDQRTRVFDALIAAYDKLSTAWTDDTVYVMPDTNFYCNYAVRFTEANWLELTTAVRVGEYDKVRVVIPYRVTRELDSHKQAPGGRTVGDTKEALRGRAQRTVKSMREVFVDPRTPVRHSDKVSFELLLDDPGPRGDPDADTEIIARAAAAHRLTGKTVFVMTDDMGMDVPAKLSDLRVIGYQRAGVLAAKDTVGA